MSTIIADAEFADAAQGLWEVCDGLALLAERYKASLDALMASDGLAGSQMTPALQGHVGQVDEVRGALADSLARLAGVTQSFIDDVDGIDSFIY